MSTTVTYEVITGARGPRGTIPDVLTPNYITLPDMVGTDIPANSIGQKSGVFYFGNTPLGDQSVRFVNDVANSTATKYLASIPIPAALMVNLQKFWLSMDVTIWNYAGTPGAFNTALILDIETDSQDDFSTGIWFDTGRAEVVNLRVEALVTIETIAGVAITESPGGIQLRMQGAQAAPGSGVVSESINLEKGLFYDSVGIPPGAVLGVDENIILKLVNPGTGVTSTKARGKASFVPLP